MAEISKLSDLNIFEDLVSCILDMQIRYRGKSIRYKRLKSLLKGGSISNKNLFSIGDLGIQSLKISQQKYSVLVNLCLYWDENQMKSFDWEFKTDDEIRTELGKIKGIGSWTIDMILLFSLQRPDVFPVDDYHLKKSMISRYNLRNDKTLKAEMHTIAEEWRPNRSQIVFQLLKQNLKS
jgi:DNA-3-methyladenine glycosylase II